MKKVRIIHTNDIHSKFEPFKKMAFVVDSLKTGNDLILDGGDFNDYSDITTLGTKGYAGLDMLNHLGYDALTIGNNEAFQNIELIEETCSWNLTNILSINVVKEDGSPIKGLKSSIIKEVNGERFLIIGVSPYKDSYELYYKKYNLKPLVPYDLIKKEINDKKGQYDFVVLLSHMGIIMDIKTAQYINDIDIIVSAHTHVVTSLYKVNNTYIQQSGVRGSHVGYFDLLIDNHKLVDVYAKNIEITSDTKENIDISNMYETYKKKAIENLTDNFTYIDEDLTYKVDEESNLTNLLCDYLYNHFKGDLALLNSGLTEKDIKKGNVSTIDVINSCNSPLYINIFDIKGKYLRLSLVESLSKEKCNENKRGPGFRGVFLGKLHVSYNCKIEVNDNEVKLYINGKEIEEDKVYKVITTDYFTNGRGYNKLINNNNIVSYKDMISDILKAALKDKESFKHINEFRWSK